MSPNDFAKTMTELGLSQVDAARLLSVDPRTVRRWVADPTEITGPAEQALKAWRRLNQLGLPWSPDSIDLVETDPDQISLHRADAVDLDNLLERVENRGGSSGAWVVDLNRNKATLGPIEVSFYRRQNGGFSPQAYTRRDDVPANLKRDWSLIEDAYACIAQKLRKI